MSVAGSVGRTERPVATVAVLVPVKAFSAAKRRLAPTLDADARRALSRAMAARVLAAAAPLSVTVVCDDGEVAEWARAHGALVAWEPGRGLNRAVQAGVARLGQAGAARVIVAHADLPLATSLGWVADFDGVTLVPDRHDEGTNVICIPTDSGFRFSYGPGSFQRHRAEAARLGLRTRVVREQLLAHDVDVPSDLVGAGCIVPTD